MATLDLFGSWECRPYQVRLWDYLNGGGKRAICVWHRRAGKDDVALRWAALSMLREPGSYWHMLPLKEQARTAIWTMVNKHTGRRRIDEAFPDALFDKRETDMMVTCKANGSTWQIKGSDNYESGIGSSVAGIVFSEYSRADPNAWTFLRPILNENKGWAIFISTPYGHNHFERLYRHAASEEGQAAGWFAETLAVNHTGAIAEDSIRQELKEQAAECGSMTEAMSKIDQEYYCSFNASVPGSYYGEVIQDAERETPTRITRVPHEPNLPVVASFDLGAGDSTAIWFAQLVGLQVRIIDYYEQSGIVDVAHYADVLRGTAARVDDQENARRTKYHYAAKPLILPHDADHERLGQAKSIRRQFRDYGFESVPLPRTDIDPGIRAARSLIKKAWFDQANCERGLDCLRQYHRKLDEKRRVYIDDPVHDWSSHAADSFRYLALGWEPSIRPEVTASRMSGHLPGRAVQSRPIRDPWSLPSR